ncbi:hypothetical protein FGRMN_4030 [Fusarium graminum]|nr:hypothetical protein FGRMN_4030 [Fusarium graminum]
MGKLVSSLNTAASSQSYSGTLDLHGYMSRCQTLEKSRTPTNALITLKQKPNYHVLELAELIILRTLMKPKVLHAISASGYIFRHDLPEATGVQDSLSCTQASRSVFRASVKCAP